MISLVLSRGTTGQYEIHASDGTWGWSTEQTLVAWREARVHPRDCGDPDCILCGVRELVARTMLERRKP